MHRILASAILVLLTLGLGLSVSAEQTGEKTPTELWLDAHRDPNQPRYFGQPIDLSLRKADLVETLRTFAEVGRFNLVIQPGVQGTVTVELKQVPWDQALEQILKINNLAMEVTGGNVRVSSRPAGLNDISPFAMVAIRLKPAHADPAVIARALNHPADGVPSPGGELRADGDSLVIRDTREALQDFARVLTHVDVPSAANEDPEALARRCVELWNKLVPAEPIKGSGPGI